jgi:hypothetical protein
VTAIGGVPAAERRRYQREIGDLLERIDEQSRRLSRLELGGARFLAQALERELKRTRGQLAERIRTRRPAPSAVAAGCTCPP